MSKQDDLPSIDPSELSAVTGGSSTDDAVTQMMTQLMSSIQDLAKNANQQNQNPMMMLLPMMMMMRQQQGAAPVAAEPESPPGDGWIRVA